MTGQPKRLTLTDGKRSLQITNTQARKLSINIKLSDYRVGWKSISNDLLRSTKNYKTSTITVSEFQFDTLFSFLVIQDS